MKVRWRADSLRLRITPGEFAALEAGGEVGESAAFPGGWSVVLRPGAESAVRASGAGSVEVVLSAGSLAELSRPETEGVYFAAEGYRFFVEKDFPCVHPRPEEAQESTETFAPPEGFAERHRTTCL